MSHEMAISRRQVGPTHAATALESLEDSCCHPRLSPLPTLTAEHLPAQHLHECMQRSPTGRQGRWGKLRPALG